MKSCCSRSKNNKEKGKKDNDAESGRGGSHYPYMHPDSYHYYSDHFQNVHDEAK